MSFLSGIVNFGKSALGFLKGNSIASTLAKTALLGLAVNKLSKSALKQNNSGTQNIDKGVRLQIKPDANAKIPVLYGDAYFGGNITDAAMTNANKTMWYCLTLAEKTGTKLSDSSATNYTFNDVYWNQQRIVFQADGITADYAVDKSGTIDRSISGLVKVYLYAGGVAGGQAPQGYTATIPNATTIFPNWGASHTMQDLVFAIVSVDYNREKNVTGIGNMLFEVTSDMKKPGDVLYDYLKSNVYGAGIPVDEINTASIAAMNAYSAETVAYNDEGTGAQTLPNRYQINGLIDTDEDVLKNAEQIASAAATWISYDTHEGTWGVIVNKAETSVASFSDDNILGNISVGGTGLQDLYNSVKVQFPHRDLRDSADYIKIEIPAGDRNANEPDNTLNITYDNINEPVQAELLGFIELKQSRVDLVVTFETDFSYINLKAGDVIDLTNERYEFVNKPFRIITVTERQDSAGALTMEITALEYDADVYSVQSITRYTRSDDDGIITIGSIGKPNTPQVTKYERAARPRIEIEAVSPSGVVEGLEYWITFDFNEADDALRSYSLIGTKKPVGGGTFNAGTTVVFDYDNIGAQNFYVKVRGFNTTTVGQFSEPSGLVEFVPEQVPDAITPDTSVLDSTGGLATALGVVSLLNNLDGLFGDTPNSPGGLFDKIFSVFSDETGVDLVGQAAGGELVVAANIAIQDEGVEVSPSVSVLNFTGASVTASADGTIITVSHDGDGGGPVIPPPVVTPAVPCSLIVTSTLPGNSGTSSTGACKSNSTVPYRGSYFISFAIQPGVSEKTEYFDGRVPSIVGGETGPAIPFYAPLQIGIGNVELYGTDGTLEQSIPESQLIVRGNVIEIPFADRMPGKDYYILIDEGLVTSCSCENLAIDSSATWSFRTSITPANTYNPPASTPLADTGVQTPDDPGSLTVVSSSPNGLGVCSSGFDFSLTFSEEVVKYVGSVIIKNRIGGNTVKTLSIDSASIVGATATWSNVTGLQPNTQYDVLVPSALVRTNRQATSQTVCDVTIDFPAAANAYNATTDFGFTTATKLEFVSATLCREVSGNVSLTSNILVNFNKGISVGTADPAYVYIYEEGGSIHQKIDIKGTFADDAVHNLYSISGATLTLNPTKPFKPGKSYYMTIAPNALQDNCEQFAGISQNFVITWSTDGIESVTPLSPTYGSIYVDLEFQRPVVPGTGKLNIVDSNGKLLTQISATDPVVKFSDEPF